MRLVAKTAVFPVWQKHRILSREAKSSSRKGHGSTFRLIAFISISNSFLIRMFTGYETQSKSAGNA